MKTIGLYLREQRKRKNLSFEDLSAKTKIRREFLVSVEKEEWDKLPEFSVVSGFVKNMADAVEMDRQQAVALLRRDYSLRNAKAEVNPRPEVPREFRLSPQLTFILGVGAVIGAIAFYLLFQYFSFTRPPALAIYTPEEEEIVFEQELSVTGKTDPGTTVIVNSQPALVQEDGLFATTIEITQNSTIIDVVAKSRAGKETRISRKIKPELE